MSFHDVICGLKINMSTVVSVVDNSTDIYLKGGFVKDVLKRYGDWQVVKSVVSSDGVIRFWLEK